MADSATAHLSRRDMHCRTRRKSASSNRVVLTIFILAILLTNTIAVKLGGKSVDDVQVSTETKKASLLTKLFPMVGTLFIR